jgi:hypothetical protein
MRVRATFDLQFSICLNQKGGVTSSVSIGIPQEDMGSKHQNPGARVNHCGHGFTHTPQPSVKK